VAGALIPVIGIVGRSKTGKTTLVEKLIPLFKSSGIRVATAKHHPHDFEIDIPGKDTYRHKKAGASTVIISSPGKIALVKDTDGDLPLEEIRARYVDEVDLLIAEGYKREEIPKIEVFPKKEGIDPVCIDDSNLLAIITDIPFNSRVPVFQRDDVELVAQFIMEKLRLSGKS
jgi:molybdopterin-guanine dinucleotide biosynthesis adapter protein